MDYLRGIFKWHIRSTDSPRYFAFGLSVRDWRSAEQRSCTVMLMSVALCVWTAASGSARCWACTSLLHTVCMAARASVSERVHARLPSQSVDSWKAVELRDTANFRFFVCFALTFYAPTAGTFCSWMRAEGIPLFIYSYLILIWTASFFI